MGGTAFETNFEAIELNESGMDKAPGHYPESIQGEDTLDKLLLGSSALNDLNNAIGRHLPYP